MNVLRWEEPPAHGNSKPKQPSPHQPIADALRTRPGEWAVVAEGKTTGGAGGLAWRIRRGYGPFAPQGAFDAKCVGPAGGSSSTVYARYVGGADEVTPLADEASHRCAYHECAEMVGPGRVYCEGHR